MLTTTSRVPGTTAFGARGVRIGCERVIDYNSELEKAVEVSESVDQFVIYAGSDWYPKAMNGGPWISHLSGTFITTLWYKAASAIVQAWYSGNETGNAIADLVFGNIDPSGKLPPSLPVRNEDNPAFLNYGSKRK